MRILVCIGEGIGNIIETLPLLVTLREAGHEVEVFITNCSFSVTKDIFPGFRVWMSSEAAEMNANAFDGKVMTIWAYVHKDDDRDVSEALESIPTLNDIGRQQMRLDTSEVRVYLNAAEELGIEEEDFTYDTKKDLGENAYYGFEHNGNDVIFADGYNYKNSTDKWWVKSYPLYPDLAEKLKSDDLRVASVGAKREHVPGTSDYTGLDLLDSFSLIKRCKCVVTNDSAMYHAAAAFGTPCVVLFTFTSVPKNYDENFHKRCDIIGVDLECRKDCHARRRWKDCPNGLKCRNIPVGSVYQKVKEKLEKK